MIITRLQGGLGNQMFQYAAARQLETDSYKNVFFDLNFLKKNHISSDTFTARHFELSIFNNLRASYLSDDLYIQLFSYGFKNRIRRFLTNSRPDVIRQTANRQTIHISRKKYVYMDGYFQSEVYFKNIRQDILRDFTFPQLDSLNESLREKMSQEVSVSIHIRRGDYLKASISKEHNVLPLEYYKKAIEKLIGCHSDTNPLSFYIFSDDPLYIKENFGFLKPYNLIEHNTGADSWKDMCLMQACKHHIVANSSFSWWGAWLADDEGLTFAPSKWNNSTTNIHDFIPESWSVIEI
ncbi:alpha-1,2-fucosyltransferase [Dysgonomonas macrotermitis]|uniref:Glycosyl transferase family 11 n=1 Tax=Dysgonomonas macrotermitis TaxID=1346286 RepID=A0A1M4SXC4_9BACT|nr:alpha-1,2-fucosyltransferase [Dysgonomonas macrotermitis]SHE36855.1 Glycosyl transferase family 11 [Dysgonomonas macrotermitis]